MSDRSLESRRFSESEVREIIARASESSPRTDSAHSMGLSLSELKDIGREVGIEPARLEEAARVVARCPRQMASSIAGIPRVLGVERRVPGTLDPTDAPEVLAVIRDVMGAHGTVGDVHGSLEWSHAGEFHHRHVAVSSSDGVTAVRGSSSLASATILTFLVAGVAGVGGTVVPTFALDELFNTGVLPVFVIPIFLFPVLLVLARLVLRNVAGAEADRLEEVADRLEAFAKPEAPEPEGG